MTSLMYRVVATVTVFGKQCDVTVERLSKSVWRATGKFEGKTVQVEGSSEGGALRLWGDSARYHENFPDAR